MQKGKIMLDYKNRLDEVSFVEELGLTVCLAGLEVGVFSPLRMISSALGSIEVSLGPFSSKNPIPIIKASPAASQPHFCHGLKELVLCFFTGT